MGVGYYDDYLYDTVTSTATNSVAHVFAIIWAIIVIILSLAAVTLTVIGMWKVFEKNKMPGWYAVIPGFNIWKYLELNGMPGWTMFLPYANVIFIGIAGYRIAIKMGKDMTFGIINAFYPFVGLMILGFSKAMPVEEKAKKEK